MTARITIYSVMTTLLLLTPVPGWAQNLSGATPVTVSYLEKWLADFDSSNHGPEDGLNLELVSRVKELSDSIQTQNDINTFRYWPNDDDIVTRLVPLAAGPRSELRIPSTLVLADVVDNTNVCHLIAYLAKTTDIGPDGQFNLLQVIRQVANSPYQDTSQWISNIVDLKAKQIGSQLYFENTSALLERTKSALRKSGNFGVLQIENPDKYKKCMELLPASVTTAQNVGAFSDTVDDLTPERIQQRLFSDMRRDYANYLAKLFTSADSDGQKAVVDKVLSSIIPDKVDPERRYRVNLYIAVTFKAMPVGALKDPQQKQAFLNLKTLSEYGQDSTFRDNVEDAIRRQGL